MALYLESEQSLALWLEVKAYFFQLDIVTELSASGAFAESSATWRWAFYINLVVGGIFAPVYVFLLPPFDPRPNQKYAERIREFDYPGALLSIAALVSIIMAINFGGTLYAWDSGQIIALFAVAGILTIMFSLQQVFTIFTRNQDRMFPIHFLNNKEAVLLFILTAAGNCAAFIPIYYIPLYFQFTRGDAALEAAVRLLPLICLISSTILFNGALMSKFGYYQPWYVGGSILILVGGILFCTYLKCL